MEEYDYSNDPQVRWACTQNWIPQKWQSRSALIHKDSNRTSLFVGQSYDPEKIDFVSDGWTHDHCEICYQDLYETEDPKHGQGFTNGHDWICSTCFIKYIEKI